MKVPFLNLKVAFKERQKLLKLTNKILTSGKILNGNEPFKLEKKLCQLTKSKYAVSVSSGSSALYLALSASGIGYDDEVITTAYSWVITSNAITSLGAKPVFVDIDENFNIDPTKIEQAITKNTKAIVPVHIAGKLCEMEKIAKIAKKNNLKIIEDAAQAFGSSFSKRKPGFFSDACAFSFNPMKVLHAYGEAGAVVTNSKKIFEKLKQLRHAGTIRKNKDNINNCVSSSLNHKIDTLQASFVLQNINRLKSIIKKRNQIFKLYSANLKEYLKHQNIKKFETHSCYLFLGRFNQRDKLKSFLSKRKIETRIFYSPLINNAPYYKSRYKNFNLKNSELFLKSVLALPMHENLTIKQIYYVISSIKIFYESKNSS